MFNATYTYLYMNNSSISDIVFDIILFFEYIYGKKVNFVDDDVYSPLFGGGNVTCALYNSTFDICDQYVKRIF